MYGQVIWFRQHLSQKPARLEDLDGEELFHGSAAAHQAVAEFAVATETLAIRQEDKTIFPADKFAAHLQDGSIRVDGALLI